MDIHFNDRAQELRGKIEQGIGKQAIRLLLRGKKEIINKFSAPFCKSNTPRIKADLWMWKKLTESEIFSEKISGDPNLLDWKGAKGSSVTAIKPRSVYDPELVEDEDSSEMPTLKTMINDEYKNVEFNNIKRFHHKISTNVDTYVTKVLFNKTLQIILNALMAYHKLRKENKSGKTDFIKYFHLGENLMIFKLFLDLYYRNEPLTLDQGTIKDMSDIIHFSVTEYIYHIINMDNPKEAAEKISTNLKDKRFHRHYAELSIEASIKLQDLFDELKQINMCMFELVQIKSQI